MQRATCDLLAQPFCDCWPGLGSHWVVSWGSHEGAGVRRRTARAVTCKVIDQTRSLGLGVPGLAMREIFQHHKTGKNVQSFWDDFPVCCFARTNLERWLWCRSRSSKSRRRKQASKPSQRRDTERAASAVNTARPCFTLTNPSRV